MERKTEGESVIVSVRIPPRLLAKIDAIAEREGRTRGNLIRLFIENGLKGREGKSQRG